MKKIKEFLSMKPEDMSIGDTFVYSLVGTAVCCVPLIAFYGALRLSEVIAEHRERKEDEEE